MGYIKCLRGLGSGVEYAPDTIMNLCPSDGKPVEIVMDIDRLKAEKPNAGWYHPGRKNMWRFGGLLPLDYDNPEDRKHIMTLGEGYTPYHDYSELPIAKQAGFRLEIKDEGMAYPGYGKNPTYTFKDRGMAMVVSMAHKAGIKKLVVPTQGNAGDSLSCYALHAGMEAEIIMPDDTPTPIAGNAAVRANMNETINLRLVKGTIREAGAYMKEHVIPRGFFNVATFQESGWRIDGKKTMGLELAEPREPGGQWALPDVVIYPTGGGTGILGMWKAFDELEALGMIGSRRPRIIAVQSENTCPLARAWAAGEKDVTPMEPGGTMATGLNVAGSVGHFRVLDVLYKSEGAAVAVTESEISQALRQVFHEKGLWVCPEGASCLAALPKLVEMDLIRKGDHVVSFNTGSLEKYLPGTRHLLV